MDAMDKHLLTLLLLFGAGVAADVQLEPLNAAALQGSTASFNASVTGTWDIMTWTVGRLFALSINKNTGVHSTAPRYEARDVSANGTSVWEFSIVNVTRNDSGSIVCAILGFDGTWEAQLSVQVQGTVDIVTGNLTVNQGEEAEFRCETSDWFPRPAVSWRMDGVEVNGNTTSQAQGTLFNSTSVLSVQAVRDTAVQCRASIPAATVSDSVYLVVVPKPTDWTVLIAVVVSFGGLALLVLLIIGIIFCCRRKKEKESIEEKERRQGKSGAARPRQGTINLGFSVDEPKSETPSVDSGQRNSPSIYQIPPVVNQNQTSENVSADVYSTPKFRKHRHVTIV